MHYWMDVEYSIFKFSNSDNTIQVKLEGRGRELVLQMGPSLELFIANFKLGKKKLICKIICLATLV